MAYDIPSSAPLDDSDAYVRSFVPLVEFLGAALGPSAEVVLHDAARPDNSVIAIVNGHVSGRRVGSPATDLMLKVLRDGTRDNRDYVIGYTGRTPQHDRLIVSSTFFIRYNGRIVGTLCINTDRTAFNTLRNSIEQFAHAYFDSSASEPQDSTGEPREENLVVSVSDMASQEIEAMSAARGGLPAEKFSVDDRMTVMRTLNDRGYFHFKGAIGKVASRLGVAESTAYRYLHAVQNEG